MPIGWIALVAYAAWVHLRPFRFGDSGGPKRRGHRFGACQPDSGGVGRRRLVVPFEEYLDTEEGYWLVYPRSRADEPTLTALRDWLLEEAQEDLRAREASESDWCKRKTAR